MAHHAVVWAEIPVTDMAKAQRYYETVLGCKLRYDDSGPNPLAALPYEQPGVSAHIYPGTPPSPAGSGPSLHLAVPALEPALERVREAGGTVLPGIEAIPFGRFAYTLDPDGNSIGLFEAKEG